MEDVLKPIRDKINQWVAYKEGEPKSNYWENKEEHDKYRSENDSDCILTGGNLKADTVISLWLPLRFTLVNLNSYQSINRRLGRIDKNSNFLRKLEKDLDKFLPLESNVVRKLAELFEIGMERENVMILPDGALNGIRGCDPYYDYMPHFLYDSFAGGTLEDFFDKGTIELMPWIEREKLGMFFDGTPPSRDNIRDLINSGSVTNNVPQSLKDLETMLDNYIDILKNRKVELESKSNDITKLE